MLKNIALLITALFITSLGYAETLYSRYELKGENGDIRPNKEYRMETFEYGFILYKGTEKETFYVADLYDEAGMLVVERETDILYRMRIWRDLGCTWVEFYPIAPDPIETRIYGFKNKRDH